MKSSLHQEARRVNYYVRMVLNDLLNEVELVIKKPDAQRRLTKCLDVKTDDPKTISKHLSEIQKEPDDDHLCKKLTDYLAKLSNKSLSSFLLGETKKVIRVYVPDDKVPWKVEYSMPDYNPTMYTAWSVLHTSLDENSPKPPWADEDFTVKKKEDLKGIKFNQVDELNGKMVDRKSREGTYQLDPQTGLPRNPKGRTGMIGRGLLGRFGPNLAADPIVTRWKKLRDGSIKKVNGKPVLECVFIQRRDNLSWAIPGGMVEPGTEVSLTLIKEFREEALNKCSNNATEAENMTKRLKETLFSKGFTIYEGYVDDPRNTDNAWMETVAKNFHDDVGVTYEFELEGGDDAFNSKWQECSSSLKLFASHKNFIERTVQKHSAYW